MAPNGLLEAKKYPHFLLLRIIGCEIAHFVRLETRDMRVYPGTGDIRLLTQLPNKLILLPYLLAEINNCGM